MGIEGPRLSGSRGKELCTFAPAWWPGPLYVWIYYYVWHWNRRSVIPQMQFYFSYFFIKHAYTNMGVWKRSPKKEILSECNHKVVIYYLSECRSQSERTGNEVNEKRCPWFPSKKSKPLHLMPGAACITVCLPCDPVILPAASTSSITPMAKLPSSSDDSPERGEKIPTSFTDIAHKKKW